MVHRKTRGDKKWYNDWQRMTTSSTSYNEWYNKWQRVPHRTKANERNFRFQNKTIVQCITTTYSARSFWNHYVKPNICRSSYRISSIKKAALKNFAIFKWKHLKVCKRFFPEYCEIFITTPVLKNICNEIICAS